MLCDFQQLVPVIQNGKNVRRSASFIDQNPVVVFHKAGVSLSPDCDYNWPSLLALLDCGPVIELEESEWSWSQQPSVNFNCHAMAIGSRIGLTPQDWLEGVASSATQDVNPTEMILDCFFDLQQTAGSISETQFDDVVEDDVFVFCDSKNSHFIHSGFVREVDGNLIAISKFGEGPILLTSLDLIEKFYAGKFDMIRWFRFRDEFDANSNEKSDQACTLAAS